MPLRRALWLDAVDLKLRDCLPVTLAAHARLANVDRGRLVYLVDGPVWHNRLRLMADQLCDSARALGLDVSGLVVKTARSPLPGLGPQTNTGSKTADAPTPAIHLSAAAREVLREVAALLDNASPEDSPDTRGRRK